MFLNLRKKIKIKEKTDHKNLKSFKATFGTVFISRVFLVFGIIFLLGNLLLYFQYTDALKVFALSEQTFLVGDIERTHPIDLLSSKFNCEGTSVNQKCNSYINVLLLLFLILEVFVIFLLFRYWKKVSKIFLAGLLLLLQLLLIIPFAVLLFSPHSVFNALAKDANQAITKNLRVLMTPEGKKKLGVEDNLQIIKGKLVNQKDLPYLAETDPRGEAILQSLGITHNNKNTLYKAAIIPYQVYFAKEIATQKEKLDFEVLLFPDNTLIVQSVNKNLVEQLAPVIAGKLVKTKFNEYVKLMNIAPIVDVPEEEEYILIRKREEEKIKRRYEESIAYVDNYIKESAGIIQTNQNRINSYPSDKQRSQREYEDYVARLGNWYQECRAELGNDPLCEEGKAKIDDNIKILKENIETVEWNKNQAEQILKLQTIYRNEAIGELNNARQNYQDFLKNPATVEIEGGIFLSPNIIHLKYQPAERYPFSYYLSVATHEYLHFYSYKTKELGSELPTFIDEGITDYLTSIIVDDFLGKQTQYIGYLNEVEIIKRVISAITEDKLKDIYFSKNENKLEGFIDSTFSKGRYKQIKSKGNLLSITKSTDKETQGGLKEEILKLLSEKQETSSSNKN